MTKLTKRIVILLTIPALFYIQTALSGTFGGSSTDGSGEDTPSVTRTVDTLEQVMTVIKNEKPEVAGSLFGTLNSSGEDALSINLLTSPAGNYGYLNISSNGAFIYELKNDLPQVQALGISEVAEEVFAYQIKDSAGIKTDAKLTIYILGNPSVSFDNVEIEFNNTSAQATSLHAGNSVQAGQQMRGQLITSSDRDWFIFNSLGDEIIHLELCPEGAQCANEKAWVMYVFDAEAFAKEADEFKTLPLKRYIKETNEFISSSEANHLYFLVNKGLFDNSLIGSIDPCFGDQRTIDLGVGSGSKNYLIAITTPLLRRDTGGDCGSGDVVRQEEISIGSNTTIIQEYLTAFPYSDDQYTLKITRTGSNPFAVLPAEYPQFDAIGKTVNIPQLRINNQLYTADLQLSTTSSNTPMNFKIQKMETQGELISTNPYLPTFNPANRVVKIPQVVVSDSGQIFSVELLYQPLDDTLTLLRAEPVN